ncbi:MAG: hypothetical protein IPL39_11310 [Opitutaceae bacterium]|nr:hypothetical protein [Opitutaceae bacterium]
MFAATLWPERDGPFIYSGFKMYRDFDGNLGEFGNISIPTTSSDTSKVAAYLSRDSAHPNRHVIVALNRSSAPQVVAFTGVALSGPARIFRLSGTRTTPVQVGTATVDANWLLSLPPYCVVTVEILGGNPPPTYATWRATAFADPNVSNDGVSGPNADPDAAGVSNFQRYAFGLAARGPVSAPTTLGTTTDAGQTYLTLTFNRRATASDLSYIVEGSTDLVNWSTVRTYAPDSDTEVVAPDSVALGTAGVTRRFLRVRLASP